MKKLTVTATGDSLFVAPFPKEYDKDLKAIRSYLASGDVRITNLETNVEKFGDFANQYSGGTWINVTPEVFPNLMKYDFNYYGTANNHCMDYSYHGLRSTRKILKSYGLATSGTGNSLAEAGAPAKIETENGSVGIIAVTANFEMPSIAGRKSLGSKARPGVNYLRSKEYFSLPKEDLDAIRKIAEHTGVNAYRDQEIAEGYDLPDPDGIFTFGNVQFCYDGSKKSSECNPKDKERLLSSVRKAKKKFDYVFVLVHSHELVGTDYADIPAFLEDFNRSLIDAGASAVIGGGVHELRPMEIYRGRPIFYSLGNFIYQGMRVEYLPADFMEKYGMPDNATAWEGLMARSHGGKVGLQTKRSNFRTVIPKMVFEGERMTSLELLPVELGFDKKDFCNGLPRIADEKEAKAIFDRLKKISKPYRPELKLTDGKIIVKIQ